MMARLQEFLEFDDTIFGKPLQLCSSWKLEKNKIDDVYRNKKLLSPLLRSPGSSRGVSIG
jgi:hypothetical protein